MTTHLHGVPLQEWVGRQVKLNSRGASGNARKPATIKSINGKSATATVQPGGHKGTVDIPITAIHPWWARNDDLRLKYRVSDDNDDAVDAASVQIQRERRFGKLDPYKFFPKPDPEVASTHHEKTNPPSLSEPDRRHQDEIHPEPEHPAHRDDRPGVQPPGQCGPIGNPPKGPPSRKEQAMTAPLKTIRKIIVDPKASSTWMEDYKALEDALQGVRDEEHRLETAKKALILAHEMVNTFIGALDGVGVQIEWEEDVVGPVKATRNKDLPVKASEQVKHIQLLLVRQLNPARSYTLEEIGSILAMNLNRSNRSLISHAFRDHSKLRFKMSHRGSPASYSIIS